MELLEIENIDFENNKATVIFDGLFETGFTVKVEFDYDEEVEEAEEETNTQRHVEPTAFSFIEFETLKVDGSKFNLNNRELTKIKQLVEFKLIDLLTKELND
jgi:hypothetical protein